MMPIYRRRRLSKRTRSRSASSSRLPIDPRVLRLRHSSGHHHHQHANIIRTLLQLVERQNSSLADLPRIRGLEKRLEEVNKRLEIFSELNDAYQALIDNLKGVQHDQSQKIDQLQKKIDTLMLAQQRSSTSAAVLGQGAPPHPPSPSADCDTCNAGAQPSTSAASLKVLDITADDFAEVGGVSVDLPQLETEIIYGFME